MTTITPTGRFRLFAVAILVVYTAGLTREISEPWIGRHDWNGAFFSQLARNFLRYPLSWHHGMPVVAMGTATPAPEDSSFYPRHPPGLVWLLAAAFRCFGESEAVARGVPILSSLGSVALLMSIISRARNRRTALITGAIYSLLPMTVYFGRMVNHEAVCLFFMLSALVSWQQRSVRCKGAAPDVAFFACSMVSVFCASWIDWPGMLFGVLFLAWIAQKTLRRQVTRTHFMVVMLCVVASGASVFSYLAYAGFEGHWIDMLYMFQSRRESVPDTSQWEPFHHAIQGLTWPILLLCVASAVSGTWRTLFGVAGRNRTAESGSRQHSDPGAPTGPVDGIAILTFTGAAWVLLFWRQFQIHEYWMYYLIPGCAASAGTLLARLVPALVDRNRTTGFLFALTVAIISITCCLQQTSAVFARVNWSMEDVEMCRDIASKTRPDERLILTWNPWHTERHGHFEFRNILTPQFAYYLDRSFEIVTDPVEIRKRQERGAFVVLRGE